MISIDTKKENSKKGYPNASNMVTITLDNYLLDNQNMIINLDIGGIL